MIKMRSKIYIKRLLFGTSIVLVALLASCFYGIFGQPKPRKVDKSPLPAPESVVSVSYLKKDTLYEIPVERYRDIYRILSKNDTIYDAPPAGDMVAHIEVSLQGNKVVSVILLIYYHPGTVESNKVFALWFQVNNGYWIGVKNPIEIIDFFLDLDREAFRSLEYFREYVDMVE